MSEKNSLFYIQRTLIYQNPQEQEIETYPHVTFMDKEATVSHLMMTITTHRILFHSKSTDDSFLIEGERILTVETKSAGFMCCASQFYLKVKTNMGKVKIYLKNFKQAEINIKNLKQKRAWENPNNSDLNNAPKLYSGLFNRMEAEKNRIKKNAQKVSTSFTSVEKLFGNLREIKDLMKDIKTDTGRADGENPEINQILKDIGFVEVIERQEAGSDYLHHLAKDLYQICENTLFKRFGGIVPLLDLFYFYNMKRQMALVSSEELLKACESFQNLGYNAQLVTYPNNIKVIESTSLSFGEDFNRIFSEYFRQFSEGWSAEGLSRKKGIPLSIVQIKLQKAAKMGMVAKDDRISGKKYYKNLLLSI